MTFVKHALLTVVALVVIAALAWGGREAVRVYQKTEVAYQTALKAEVVLQHLAGPIVAEFDAKGQPKYLVTDKGQAVTRLMLLERLIVQSAQGK